MKKFFASFIDFLDMDMPVPEPYDEFHICFVIITALSCFLLCRYFPAPSEKTLRIILLVYALVCIFLEVYKQLSFTFDVTDAGEITSGYQWYAFPFQFCSIPMYAALLAALIPSKKFLHGAISFLATFGVIAGVLVMATPTTVFIDTIGINIQTMVHHGGQICIGLYLLIKGGACKTLGAELGGIGFFLGAVGTALILDCTVIHLLPEGTTFDMFFLSPYFDTTLPVYVNIEPCVSFPVFVLLYVFPFITVSLLMYACKTSIPRLIAEHKNKKAIKAN